MDDDARSKIALLAANTVPRLIERMTMSQLGELEVREDGWRIRLRRPAAAALDDARAQSRSAMGRPHAGSTGSVTGAHTERVSSTARHGPPTRPDTTRGRVTSPAVGYFVARDGVSSGTTVASGDVLGHVDVLGVRQEVVAPIDGVLGGLEVETGQAIEYGQRIARIEAETTGSPSDSSDAHPAQPATLS